MNKITNVIKLIKTFKNWQDIGIDYLGLKKDTYILETRDGLKIKLRPGCSVFGSDLGVVNELIIRPFFDDFRNINTVIDIGAHIGIFSLLAAINMGTVYSYEPFFESFKILEENIKINHMTKTIKPFMLAIAGKKGIREFKLYGSPACASLTNESFQKMSGKITVTCTTLKDIFDKNKIERCDLLKIDAEGAEHEILFNTPKKYFRRINTIFVECANWVNPNNPQEIKEFLESLDYFITDEYEDYFDTLLIGRKSI